MTTIITPNTKGHRVGYSALSTYTDGTRVPSIGGMASDDPEKNLERIDDERPSPELLQLMQQAVRDAAQDADWYYRRNQSAWDAWHARWDGQTNDGRKWGTDFETQAWPWPGSSDTRVRLTEKVMSQHLTVAMFAVMNQKVQAKATRPIESNRESQQGTTLLNWMIFTHMGAELDLEIPLLLNARNGFGASVLEVTWEQERRIDYVPASLMTMQAHAQQAGETGRLDEFTQALFDPSLEEESIAMVQSMSPIISRTEAKAILKDLRELRTAEIPIPYVFKSKPRWSALRLMQDIIIPAGIGNLQRSPWIDRVEWVTETELVDRIATAQYDADFVDQALEKKAGKTNDGSRPWTNRLNAAGGASVGTRVNGDADDFENKIELHHFYRKGLDRETPTMFCTVFHPDVEVEAKHGPYGYDHGQYPFHPFRFEKHARSLLSSRGIPEITYTWEQEIKAQRDGRVDRTAMALNPPLMAPYQDVLRLKAEFMPGAIIPERRAGDIRWFQAPAYDSGSVDLERSLSEMCEQHFALFGLTVDPSEKQLKQTEMGDAILKEFKPVLAQTFALMQQYLPDEEVARVVGQLTRPFHVDRREIQGAYDITATVDMRELDREWIKEKLGYLTQIVGLDTMGLIDKAKLIKIGMQAIDYATADELVQDEQPASNKEITDEMTAVSLMLGSGIEQPMPMGANYSLRLQTLQNSIQGSPPAQKTLQQDPDKQKLVENRVQFFQRQLQQQENAQIGRVQVQSAFGTDAAKLEQG